MPRRKSNLGRRTRHSEGSRRRLSNMSEEKRASVRAKNRVNTFLMRYAEPAERRTARLEDARKRIRKSRSAATDLTIKMSECVREIEGDLFAAPKDHSLAHCVAADLKMGGGIAVKFKQVFKKIDELKAQSVGVGGVAVLKDEKRYVYYLVTKKASYDKPTYDDLTKSLEAMKKHMSENGAKKLAIPRIGCGIDGLEWNKVKSILNGTFGGAGDFEIVVYNFVPK
ncbi:ADP-ribose glycohydrolase OARD1-like isoform X2 [Toxorhynchites rutilus septentrionalis]|uniref:ADP-ribose glycohydrolase OARD1-like isoform X2 n=1 Tax=Toxorhynchites rutilus septentrionalis TaxID=329112 RepID=UPI00247AFFB2|nr:ADP-ribose glycohydrolase OARD1-like isoform X2 [Toxorhynchites rutilus septentrionalis]